MRRVSRITVSVLMLIACTQETDATASAAATQLPVSCAAVAKRESSGCGQAEDIRGLECERARQQYVPIGCGVEAAAYYGCNLSDPVDCERTSNRCPGPDGYLQCQAQFVRTTGCSRRIPEDATCSAGMFAFTCLSALPKGCVEAGPSTLGKLVCCPSFAKGESPFVD